MKIIACPAETGACAHYRIFSPYWKLAAKPGVTVAFTFDAADTNFDKADVMVMPRIHTQLGLDVMKKFKASGRPVILDFDDNFHEIPWHSPVRKDFFPGSEDVRRFEEALDLATIVTASTQALAD